MPSDILGFITKLVALKQFSILISQPFWIILIVPRLENLIFDSIFSCPFKDWEVSEGHRNVFKHIPTIMDISVILDRFWFMIDLASNKKFLIVEYILEKKEFTQYQIKKDLKTGMSVVNETVGFLLEKDVIKKTEKNYVLSDPEGLIELAAFFRNMEKLKIAEISTSLEKLETIKLVPPEVVFCLETALEKYSNYYKSNRVSFYADEKTAKELQKKLAYKPGNAIVIEVYKEKPIISKTDAGMSNWEKLGIKNAEKLKFTTKIRTIIDLYSAKKGNAAEKLVEYLWGKKKLPA